MDDFGNLDGDDIKLALGTLLLRALSAEKRLYELTEESEEPVRLRRHRAPPEEGPPAA